MVLLTHARGFVFSEYGALDPADQGVLTAIFFAFTRLGHEAVIVFFALSGFLVGGKAIERIKNGVFIPGEYAIDRTTRILVPLVPALLLSSIASGFSDEVHVWLGNLIGLQGILVPMLEANGVLWSLAYEVWFYVLFYAIGRLLIRRNFDIAAILLIALVALVFTKLHVQYLICWLIGAAIYLRPPKASIATSLTIATALCVISAAGLQLTGSGFASQFSASGTSRAALEVLLAAGASLACAVALKAKPSPLNSITTSLVGFSYTLYLTHYPILILLRKLGLERSPVITFREVGIYVALTFFCLACAWLIYLPFERKTVDIRDWLRKKIN